MKNYREILKENCDIMIPTKWNIYEWAEKHPDTTIAHSLKRIEKIFDFSSALQLGFSGGKDSTATANLACLELNLRRLRLKYGVDRYGNPGIDPLDEKWRNKRLHLAMSDAEVVFSFTNDYAKRFIENYGPNGKYNLGGLEYKANDILVLKNGSKDTAENIYHRVILGEEIELQ